MELSEMRKDIISMVKAAESYEYDSDMEDEPSELEALSIETIIHEEVMLTVGGPTVYLDFVLDYNHNLIRATYEYHWYPENLSMPLMEEEAETLARYYNIIE